MDASVMGGLSNIFDRPAIFQTTSIQEVRMLSAKRLAASAVVVTATASAALVGVGGVAQADVPVWQANCHVYNIFNTGGMANCELPTWHQVKLTCVAWPVPFVYWKYGPAQYGQNQSWASCDSLNALVGIEVIQA
ncbi:hypothetical protein ACFWPK_10705 [Nocardia sp. NPDC058519]|uniref:hypothetical protein n=1 Tax=unclassified Nocardia TaxID=2637762 RepID=UPI0036657A2A